MCQENQDSFCQTNYIGWFGSITIIQKLRPSQNIGSILTNQPPKEARVTSLAGKVMLVVFRNQDGVVMKFPSKRYYNYRGLLRFTATEIAGSYQNQNASQRCPPYTGQCPCFQFSHCLDGTAVPWLHLSSHSLFSWPRTNWLSSLYVHEVIFEEKTFLRGWGPDFWSLCGFKRNLWAVEFTVVTENDLWVKEWKSTCALCR